jgi:hypothetical protein
MAYSKGWDASTPDGAITPAADIDVEIQDTKVAVGERLAEFVPEWADDLAQPKKISIQSGDHSARPATPDFQGELWFSIDTQTLYIGNAALEWVSTGGVVEEGDTETPSTSLFVAGYLAAQASIPPTGAWVKLQGWIIPNQSGSFYDAGSPSRFSVSTTGSYKVSGSFNILPSNSPTTVMAGTNGFTPPTGIAAGPVGGVDNAACSFSTIMTFSTGGYIEFWAKNTGLSNSFVYTTSNITIHRLP